MDSIGEPDRFGIVPGPAGTAGGGTPYAGAPYAGAPYAAIPFQGYPPLPTRRRPSPTQIVVISVLALLAVAGVTGYVVGTRPGPTRTVTLPSSVDGMSEVASATLQQAMSVPLAQVERGGATDAQAQLYTTGNQPTMLVMAADGLAHIHGSADDFMASVTHGFATNSNGTASLTLAPMSAGPLGGHVRCGDASVSGKSLPLCLWIDHNTFGMVMGFFGTVDQTHSESLRVRRLTEH